MKDRRGKVQLLRIKLKDKVWYMNVWSVIDEESNGLGRKGKGTHYVIC